MCSVLVYNQKIDFNLILLILSSNERLFSREIVIRFSAANRNVFILQLKMSFFSETISHSYFKATLRLARNKARSHVARFCEKFKLISVPIFLRISVLTLS